jgi:hypothetical protein
MHSHCTERGTHSFLYTERFFFCKGLLLVNIVRQEILSAYSPCILMTVVRMLFFDVLNLTVFLKRGTSVSQFLSAGWWFVCFLTAHLSTVEEKC